MSDLQCAARLILAGHGATESGDRVPAEVQVGLTPAGRAQARQLADRLRDARVSMIYCAAAVPAVQSAEIASAELGVAVRVRPELDAPQTQAEELQSIVDLHRGETVLVVATRDAVLGVVPRLVGNLPTGLAASQPLDECATVHVDADADGWVVRSWADQPV